MQFRILNERDVEFYSIIGDNKYYGILVNFVVLICVLGGLLSGLGVVVVVDLVDFLFGMFILEFVIEVYSYLVLNFVDKRSN